MQSNLFFMLDYQHGKKPKYDCKNFGSAFWKFENNNFFCIIIGNPILSETIDNKKVFEYLSAGGNPSKLNSQFLIILYEKKKELFHIFNDRFTSFPLYYANISGKYFFSFSYSDLISKLKRYIKIDFVSSHIYEYIRLQRLVGDKTLDKYSKFLMPASHLTINNDQISVKVYWKPCFRKIKVSRKRAGQQLAHLLQQSLRRLGSDNKRMGLFLSGGHDSRTIAMASDRDLTCYTVSFSDNLEVELARDIAKSVGFTHKFIKLPENHYYNIARDSAAICGGMYSIDNALFLDLNYNFKNDIDVILHGHGIDYLFQGMYLPSKTLSLFGRPTFIKSLKKVPKNVAQFFTETISYRLKYVNHNDFILEKFKTSVEKELVQSVEDSMKNMIAENLSPSDKWEFLTINGLSRHYSWPNIASKMTLAPVRTPIFDNDIFDFYLSLPSKLRVTAGALRAAQNLLNKDTALIATANFGLPSSESPTRKTLRLISRKILRDVANKKNLVAPSLADRTWPDRDIYLNEALPFQKLVNEALNSKLLQNSLPELDWKKIIPKAESWMKEPSGGAGFLISLTTIFLFLKRFE